MELAALYDLKLGNNALLSFYVAPTGDPALGQHSRHFGNHVPGTANDHGIADPHVLAGELIHIVQSRVAHRDSADEYRLQPCHGRQGAGAAHLKFHRTHRRQRFFGREFVRHRPARRARDEAKLPLQLQILDLVDHAVDLIGQVRPQ